VKPHTRFDLHWILVLVLTVFAVAPLTYPGFFEAESGFLPAFNAAHLSEAPNWAGISGPVRGEGFLPYLLARPFYALSTSGVVAIKWGYGIAFLAGALGVYAWTRRWLGPKGAVLAATVYTYLPWHLNTVYSRGAYAEAWLWALWPWILWAIDRLAERHSRSMLVGIAACLVLVAATLWTQPGLATLALPLLFAYGVVVTVRRPGHWLHFIEAVGLGLLLVWLASRKAAETQIPFSEHFLHPFQLFSAAWGDGLSYQLGLAAVGLSIVAVALQVSRRDASPSADGVAKLSEDTQSAREIRSGPSSSLHFAVWFWVGSLSAVILLCLPIAGWLWRISGTDALLTYPWQLLALGGLPLTFLAGSVIRLDERLAGLPAWAGVVALVVLASYPYLAPSYTQVDPGPDPVALLQPVEAGAPQILLLDYEIEQPVELSMTQPLTLTLAWQVVEPVAEDYTVFVHVLTADGTKIAQRDTRPCDGECPSDSWKPGEIIMDRHQLTWTQEPGADAAGARSQPAKLAVGLYLLESGDRAIVVGREDRTVFLDVR
jgi:hypothetical protein